MDCSVFLDKESEPTEEMLKDYLRSTHSLWLSIRKMTFDHYPDAKEEWNFPGKKFGWSFRIKDKKRAIIYLLPRDSYLKVAFVFGQKATDAIMSSDIDSGIKEELATARVYAEGRGISISVENDRLLSDIDKLISIKLKF